MKTAKLSMILTSVFIAVLALSCGTTGGGGGGGAGEGLPSAWAWGTFTDAANQGSSRISLIEDVENIGGDVLMTYNISGEITNQYEYGYAGWYAFPDDPTKELLKTIKSFSFKVLGDGNTYFVMLATSDITDASFYRTTFTTKKDQVTTVNVRVGSLAQPEDWGIKKRFNQANATQIQWQTTNNGKPGTFKLKIYDLKIYE
jgi:hypothetical protein